MIVYMTKEEVEALSPAQLTKLANELNMGTNYAKLRDYYDGKHGIMDRVMSDFSLPNNKLVANMPRYITTISTGYFMGMGVGYGGEDDALLETLQGDFAYNDVQDEDYELAKLCSIYGHCYEVLYIDEDGRRRFMAVPPGEATLFLDPGKKMPTGFLWLREHKSPLNSRVLQKMELYTYTSVKVYSRNGQISNTFAEELSVSHLWGDVPVVEYINNEERFGDYECVISLVDAYNLVQSNTANTFETNDDAILIIKRMGDVQSKDVKQLKEEKAVTLPDGAELEWLTKQLNDSALEHYKDRLREDMHIFSMVPNLTDKEFGSNASGVAMSYKLWGLDQLFSIKARKFKKALQRRVELLTHIINLAKPAGYDYTSITITFHPNKPQNLVELAQMVASLAGEVSRETRLQLLPFVEDVPAELEKLKEEERQATAEVDTSYSALAKNQTPLTQPPTLPPEPGEVTDNADRS